MSWLATTTGIITSSVPYYAKIIFWPSGYVIKRLVTRTTTEYRGLTSAGADSQVTTSLAVSGVLSVRKDLREGGQCVVTEEKETYGAWEYDETYAEVGP
jgi:hypothetical protein